MSYRSLTLGEIRGIPLVELRAQAKKLGIKGPTSMGKEELEVTIYEKICEIEEKRRVPSVLRRPKSIAGVIDKNARTKEDVCNFDPFPPKDYMPPKLVDVVGWFMPYGDGDGILCKSFVPSVTDDIFVNESFVQWAKLLPGDKVVGKYAVSKHSGLKMLFKVVSVNGKSINDHRDPDISEMKKFPAAEYIPFDTDVRNLKALQFAAPLKKGARILFSHDAECVLTGYVLSLSEALERAGMLTLRLHFGIFADEADKLSGERVTVCPFDLEDEFIDRAAIMLIEVASRYAESGSNVAVLVTGLEYIPDPQILRKLLSCACALDKGSITVFAAVNDEIMDRRVAGLLSAGSHALVRFECRDGVEIDFGASRVRNDWEYDEQFRALKEAGREIANKVVAQAFGPHSVTRILKELTR